MNRLALYVTEIENGYVIDTGNPYDSPGRFNTEHKRYVAKSVTDLTKLVGDLAIAAKPLLVIKEGPKK